MAKRTRAAAQEKVRRPGGIKRTGPQKANQNFTAAPTRNECRLIGMPSTELSWAYSHSPRTKTPSESPPHMSSFQHIEAEWVVVARLGPEAKFSPRN